MYYIYVLRCSDNSLYTGITNDVRRRVREHYYQKPRCARYTKSHKVVSLEAMWNAEDKSSALKFESKIKALSKTEKEDLIKSGGDFEGCERITGITIEKCLRQDSTK